MKLRHCFIAMLLSLFVISPDATMHRLMIGNFSSSDTSNWKLKTFAGTTEYSLTDFENQTVLKAESKATAAAFYYEVKVDLTKTPYLNWSWQKLNTLDPGDENTKAGDDFVARVYVVKDGGLFIWNTRALNYVWSYSHQQGDSWDNPFAGDKARMIAVRDQEYPAGKWFYEKRNVLEDFKQQFGKEFTEIDGVAIMTDTDNSGGTASALYGDIFFTAD